MIYIFLFILFIISVFAAVSLFSLIITQVPFVSLSRKKIREIIKKIDFSNGRLLLDLGCGDGKFLIEAVKKYPNLQAAGFELNLWAYLRAQINIILSKSSSQVKIYYKNFHQVNLSQADFIYCYLWPGAMEKLKAKFQKELKTGALILSYAFPIKNWIKPKTERISKGNLYFYQIPQAA